MKITGNSAMSPMATTNTNRTVPTSVKAEKGASFDQITFNNRMSVQGDSRTLQEEATKISNEVRTHNTTSKIAQIREEVQAGTYQMDARETAARMLLMGDVE